MLFLLGEAVTACSARWSRGAGGAGIMFRIEPDGSAVVHSIPIAPFLPVQHFLIDVSSVNRLANYGLAFARERGWLQTQAELAMSTPYQESNAARPLVEQEGYAHKGSDKTFFYAGVEAALASDHPHFQYPPTPSTLLLWCHFVLSHVGNSSYGVYGELYTYLDKSGSGASPGPHDRSLLGTFKVTAVLVSKLTRTPCPLSEDKKAIFAEIYGASAELRSGKETVVQRLSVPTMLQSCGWFSDVAAMKAMQLNEEALPAENFHTTLPGSDTPLCLAYRRSIALRESDFDFNLHLNQLVTKQLIINAFRGAVADESCAYSRLLRPGVNRLRADLLLRRFRIDYVREIPMRYAATEVYFFPFDAPQMVAQLKKGCGADGPTNLERWTSGELQKAEMMQIGFFTIGVPSAPTGKPGDGVAADDRFLATVGVLQAPTYFLH